MLTSLQIENVAVIQKADVRFEKGLNVLTGETGAGKSILIDSINAILGSRTSRELVRAGAAKAVIRRSPSATMSRFSPMSGTLSATVETAAMSIKSYASSPSSAQAILKATPAPQRLSYG